MNTDIISFTTAKLAKAKGFKYGSPYVYNHFPAFGYLEGVAYKICEMSRHTQMIFINFQPNSFDDCYEAPTQAILQRWLREEHKKHINAIYTLKLDRNAVYTVEIDGVRLLKEFSTYESALEHGLAESLLTL